MSKEVSITEAIRDLRLQLEKAQNEGTDRTLRFVVTTVEVELTVVFKSETEGKAGIKAWLVDASVKGAYSNEATHKLKLVLSPTDREGKAILVSDTGHEDEQ